MTIEFDRDLYSLLHIDSETEPEIDTATLSNLSRVTRVGFAQMGLLHEKSFHKHLKFTADYWSNIFELWDKGYEFQEVCVTLRPEYQNYEDDFMDYQFRSFMNEYHRKYRVLYSPHYLFVPEYTARGITHWHGIVTYPSCAVARTAELKRKLNRRFGLTAGKEVYNICNYWQYMIKDINNHKLGLSYVTNFQVGLGKITKKDIKYFEELFRIKDDSE